MLGAGRKGRGWRWRRWGSSGCSPVGDGLSFAPGERLVEAAVEGMVLMRMMGVLVSLLNTAHLNCRIR